MFCTAEKLSPPSVVRFVNTSEGTSDEPSNQVIQMASNASVASRGAKANEPEGDSDASTVRTIAPFSTRTYMTVDFEASWVG